MEPFPGSASPRCLHKGPTLKIQAPLPDPAPPHLRGRGASTAMFWNVLSALLRSLCLCSLPLFLSRRKHEVDPPCTVLASSPWPRAWPWRIGEQNRPPVPASPTLGSFTAAGDVIHRSLWLDGCQRPHFTNTKTDALGKYNTFG